MAPQRAAGPGRGGQPPPGSDQVRPAQQKAQQQAQQAQQQAMQEPPVKRPALQPLPPGQRQGGPPNRAAIQVDVRAIAPDTSEESVQRAIETLLAGGASDATRQILAKARTPQELVALTLGSPEFQKR